jgi:peptide/nickel transport system substrate-binding protein
MLGRRSAVLKVAVGAAAVALVATACSSGSSSSTTGKSNAGTSSANTWNAANVKKGGTLTFALEDPVNFYNVNDASGTDTANVYVLYPLAQDAFVPQPDYSIKMNTDMLVSASMTSSSPQTVVYKIQPKAVWNDGTPITADDFIYNWIAENGSDANIPAASTVGYSDIASITGSDNGKTVTVTWKSGKTFPDWQSLFANMLPAHIAEQHGYKPGTKTGADGTVSSVDPTGLAQSWTWFGATVPTWSDGPYQIQSANKAGTTIVEVPNPKWYGSGPNIQKLIFSQVSGGTGSIDAEATALQNNELQMIYPQPSVDLINELKSMGSSVKYKVNSGLDFEHLDFNLANQTLGKESWSLPLRQAILTAVNRQEIISKTVGQFDPSVKPLNSSMFVPGLAGYQDDVTQYDLGQGDTAKAKSILTKAGFKGVGTKLVAPDGTPVPALTCVWLAGNLIRENECQIISANAKQVGITINPVQTDDLGKSLTSADAQHQWDLIVFAWVSSPFWRSGNPPLYVGQNKPGIIGENYGQWYNAQVNTLMNESLTNMNATQAAQEQNAADKIMEQQAWTLPLYQKPTTIAVRSNVGNVRDNATSIGPIYNVQDWGFTSGS